MQTPISELKNLVLKLQDTPNKDSDTLKKARETPASTLAALEKAQNELIEQYRKHHAELDHAMKAGEFICWQHQDASRQAALDALPDRIALADSVALHHSGTSKNCTCLGDETLKEYGDKKKEKQ